MNQDPRLISATEIAVASYDVDARGRMTTAALGRYMQELAEVNAAGLGAGFDDLRAAGQTWVLVGLLIRAERLPAWRERVSLETWPRDLVQRRALRDFRLRDDRGAVIAAASTAWYCLDLASRRPVSPERWRTVTWPQAMRATERDPGRLPGVPGLIRDAAAGPAASGSAAVGTTVTEANETETAAAATAVAETAVAVRWSDLDLLGHVTNTRYHDLLLESYPPDWLAARELAEIELAFLAEGRYPAKLISRRAPDRGAENAWHHSLVRADDGREIARARIAWR